MPSDPNNFEPKSPVEVAVNSAYRYREGQFGVIDVELRNDAELPLAVTLEVGARFLTTSLTCRRRLSADERARWSPEPFFFPAPSDDGTGSAGQQRFSVRLLLDDGEGERHRFSGVFDAEVLPSLERSGPINVNIGIHQSGQNAGMGAVNEINVGDVKLGEDESSIDGTPRFRRLALRYEGPDTSSGVVRRVAQPLRRAQLLSSDGRVVRILTGDEIRIGRHREHADVVTWHLPRGPETDTKTALISGDQCRFVMGQAGPIVRHTSRSNPTTLGGVPVERDAPLPLPTDAPSELAFRSGFTLRLTPLPYRETPGVGAGASWSARSGVGGWLLERTDAYRGRACWLWVISATAESSLPSWGRELPSLVAADRGIGSFGEGSELEIDQRLGGEDDWIVAPFDGVEPI